MPRDATVYPDADLHPDFDAMIAGILERDPKAEIAIFADPDARASDVVARRMRSLWVLRATG